MGFFKREPAPTAPTTPTARTNEPIIITDEDLASADSALSKMEDALLGSSDEAIRSSARALAWAGGTQPQGDFLRWTMDMKMKDPDANPTARPYWWLVAVADEAAKRGDFRLACRIGFFLHGWQEWVAPKMKLADDLDCHGMKSIPREAYAKGLGLAVMAVDPLPEDQIIVETQEQFVPVGRLRPTLAAALLMLDQSGVAVDPDARNAALRAVN
jgi:hypothetical protein